MRQRAQVWQRFWAALGVVLVASGAFAQALPPTAETGFQPNRDYLALLPWESIDTASGNLVLTFTDLELPVNGGRALRFQRVYNNGVTPGVDATQWTFGLAGVPMRIVESNGVLLWVVMPDGGYAPAQFEGTSSNPGWMVTSRFGRYNRVSRLHYLPDGLVVHYNEDDRADWFRDPHGNGTTLTWDIDTEQSQLIVTDSLGRTVVLSGAGNGRFEQMTFEGRQWEFERGLTGNPDLTSVTLPEGLTWTFGTVLASRITSGSPVAPPPGPEPESAASSRPSSVVGCLVWRLARSFEVYDPHECRDSCS